MCAMCCFNVIFHMVLNRAPVEWGPWVTIEYTTMDFVRYQIVFPLWKNMTAARKTQNRC